MLAVKLNRDGLVNHLNYPLTMQYYLEKKSVEFRYYEDSEVHFSYNTQLVVNV